MDIEKLKAEFEQSECFKRLEHVAQYTFFEFGAYIKRTDVPADIEKKCGKLITSLLFSWSAWKEAKAQAVPEVISIGNELQSWVAVNSFGAEDVVGDLVIIDANELAEVIEKLTGANA
ncbi:hypothetical protein [Acinetobacter sp. YH12226]|uniref:hypothetical protein n=1 Tax=Acinetobacter sp. YH12226 TaxID=2601157 RepID=UPI0015D23403|nr:hypothetical protein [Acinetobacter sp. YH12226]